MKKICLLIILSLIGSNAYAQNAGRTAGRKPILIQEEDGSPSSRFKVLKVSNTTLTDNGDGTGSLANLGNETGIQDADGDTKILTDKDDADSDEIRFENAESLSMILDSTGELGVNVNPPVANLHIKADGITTGTVLLIEDGNGADILKMFDSGTLSILNQQGGDHLVVGDNDEFAVDANNVGIGTSSPSDPLEILSTTDPQVRITHTDGIDDLTIGVDSNGDVTFTPSGTDINISGKLGINTETIPHGGTGQAKLAIDGTNASSTDAPAIQFTTASDNNPLFHILPYTHDNIQLGFDAYFDGVWKSSDAGSNFNIRKLSDTLRMAYAVATPVGNNIAWVDLLTLQNDGDMGVGTTTPGEDLAETAIDYSGNATVFHFKDTDGPAILTFEGNDNTFPVLFDWIDNGAVADDKVMRITLNNGIMHWDSKLDTFVNRHDNILVLDMGTGFVGMSDDSPDAHLEVSASSGSGGDIFYLSASDGGNGDIMAVQEDGDVGIGQSSPSSFLDLKKDAVNIIELDRTANANIDDNFYIGVGTPGSTADDYMWLGDDTGASDRHLVITASGKVGINTRSPGTELHLTQATSGDRGIISALHGATTNAALMVFRRSRGSEGTPTTISNGDKIGLFRAQGHDGTAYRNPAFFGFETDGTVATNSVPTAVTFGSGVTDFGTERMRITSGGDIGINDTTPDAHLEISADGGSGGSAFDVSANDSGDGDLFTVLESGNVGIGVNDPDEIVEIRTDSGTGAAVRLGALGGVGSYAAIGLSDDTTLAKANLFSSVSATDPNFYINTESNTNMFFRHGGLTNRMVINTAGNVGIPTDTPDNLLHVETNDAGTNTVTYPLRIGHTTSGTATTGFGAGLEFETEGADATMLVTGIIEVELTDASTGSEDSAMKFMTSKAGAVATESMRIDTLGYVGINDASPGAVLEVGGDQAWTPQAVTCADTGDANPCTVTLTPTSTVVQITCNDANSCDVTMGESGIADGQHVKIVNVSANTTDFADSSGVSELAGAFAAGQWDTITMTYHSDRWVEDSRSDN